MFHSGDDINAIVADIGSYSCRIGYAGDDTPRANFPTVRKIPDAFFFLRDYSFLPFLRTSASLPIEAAMTLMISSFLLINIAIPWILYLL
jgi:hypothetical protein